jgi:ferric-dicitrate binding protein FerR (iron transport regulator)
MSIERLIKLAGQRDLPSEEGTQRARVAAEEAWRRGLEQSRGAAMRRRWPAVLGFALAAGIAGIAVLLWMKPAAEIPAMPVANVLEVQGVVTLRTGDRVMPASARAPVCSGAIISSADGRLAAALGTLSLRLDRETRLRVDSRDHLTLLQGSIYVDSGGLNVASTLRIATPAGEVRHLGTQFQVTVSGETTRVRVREGRVLVTPASGAAAQDLATGDEFEVRGAETRLRHGLPAYGAAWEWAAGVAPPLDIENRPLAEFLSWMAREHGWQLRFAAAELQARTRDIRLHGSFEGLAAADMLERVSLVTGVPVSESSGELWVGQKP